MITIFVYVMRTAFGLRIIMSCGKRCAHILVELSLYQHQCYIVSLIASFFVLHAFLVDIRHSICQFVCIANCMTAEPDYFGCPAKPKERMSGKSLFPSRNSNLTDIPPHDNEVDARAQRRNTENKTKRKKKKRTEPKPRLGPSARVIILITTTTI